jgi:hypothetical protein
MVRTTITKRKGSNVGMPKKKNVYFITSKGTGGRIMSDEKAFKKFAANKIAKTLRAHYKKHPNKPY